MRVTKCDAVTLHGSLVWLGKRIQEWIQKQLSFRSLFGKQDYRKRQEYKPSSWSKGRPRGSCPERTIGSLRYMKGDEYLFTKWN